MTKRYRTSLFAYPFLTALLLTLTVYLLRALQILTFFPGWILLVLLAITLVLGFLYALEQLKRL